MIVELVSILFACTSAIHLGLCEEIEKAVGIKLRVLECAKCLSFWCTLVYMVIFSRYAFFVCTALAFVNAWLSLWLEMCMGFIDTLYDKVYEKIYPTTADNDTDSADNESRADK